MKPSFVLLLLTLICSQAFAQDTLGISIRNEVFPVYHTQREGLGEGLAFELQKDIDAKSSLGIGYSKITFGNEHSARNMEVLYYNQSDNTKKVRVGLGIGFFIRQWTDMVMNDQSPEALEKTSFTTGYMVSLGAKAAITKSLSFSTRFSFNNNIDSNMSYTLRPGLILSI